jgi:CBS domain-containing protein
MNIDQLRTPEVLTTTAEQALATAAALMRDGHVGALVVVDPADGKQRPIGMLTDRDIVRGQLARRADLYCLSVGDVMTPDPLTLPADMDLGSAIAALNARAVRRAPVLDRSGRLIGIVTLDDLLPAIARELSALANLMGTQAHVESRRALTPDRARDLSVPYPRPHT